MSPRVEDRAADRHPGASRQGRDREVGLESALSTADHEGMSRGPCPYLTGRLLVAMPGIEDPRFERAVVFLCVHDAEHAMGLTVNRPVEGLTIAKLLGRLGVKSPAKALDDLVLMGGPVEPERGFVLHTDDYACEPSSLAIGGGVALTATREVLQAMAGAEPCTRRAVMALGYAGM